MQALRPATRHATARGGPLGENPVIPWPGSEAAALLQASAHFKAGQYADAAGFYAQVLERNPDQVQALVFLGVMRVTAGEIGAAETLFTRCLAVDPRSPFAPLALHNLGGIHQRRGDDKAAIGFFERCVALKPDYAAAFNDLGVSLQRLGRHRAAIDAFDRAIGLDPSNLLAQHNRGLVLDFVGRTRDALDAFQRLVALAPDSAENWLELGLVQFKLENFDGAEEAFRKVLALEPASLDAQLHLAEALDRNHRVEEADRLCDAWARRQGVVVKPCTAGQPQARVLLLGAPRFGNTPTRFLFGNDRFETITINLLPGKAGEDQVIGPEQLPPFDIVFNAISDVDRGAPFLDPAASLCRQIGRPVINPPAQIPQTRRDRAPALFAGIPGLVIPPTRRASRADLQALSAASAPFARPILVRPTGAHGGADLQRMGDPGALAEYLQAMPYQDYYVTDYQDYRSADGYYRKYRLIFVDREIYPCHLAISKHWLVHYWRADMAEARWKREEAAFLADYENAFPGALAETVRAVARRLDLDYAGMDCGITADGRVLLFEANASMLVHLDEPREDFPYKHAYIPKIADAISRLVARKLSS
jgi:tetratricopeptide (TPR) repeat protein